MSSAQTASIRNITSVRLVSRKNTNTARGWMPLGMTQFLSARYHQAGPLPAYNSGATGCDVRCVNSRASIRDPAIESPMMTQDGFSSRRFSIGSASNGVRGRGPSSAGK